MRVLIVFNPISGTGRSAATSREFARALRHAGHDAFELASERGAAEGWLDPFLVGRDLLVVVGGDGAVRNACASARRRDVPLYQVPSGTENLFAREMGMDRSTSTLIRAMERRTIARIDLGDINGQPFMLMASLGFDARVVSDLASRRNGAITHWAYAGPCIRQFAAWRPGRTIVRVNGDRIDGDQPGFVIVANCRQYGWRLNPASQATMTDGRLDAVFFPCSSRMRLLHWIIQCRRQRHLEGGAAIYRTGTRIEIECERDERVQIDGDSIPRAALRGQPGRPHLEIAVRPAAVPVLMPASGPR